MSMVKKLTFLWRVGRKHADFPPEFSPLAASMNTGIWLSIGWYATTMTWPMKLEWSAKTIYTTRRPAHAKVSASVKLFDYLTCIGWISVLSPCRFQSGGQMQMSQRGGSPSRIERSIHKTSHK